MLKKMIKISKRKAKVEKRNLRMSSLKKYDKNEQKCKEKDETNEEKTKRNLRLSSLKEKGDISPAEPGTRLISLS